MAFCISAHTMGISTHTLTWSVTIAYGIIDDRGRISTHTLTWSVTVNLNKIEGVMAISTHTLTWSVTYKDRFQKNVTRNFNSHAHVERDQTTLHIEWANLISTHTLTWSVTY